MTDEPLGYPREVQPGDVDAVVDRLEQLVTGDTTPEFSLIIDGVPMQCSPFVRQLFASTLAGMVTSLKDVPARPRRIEIVVRPV